MTIGIATLPSGASQLDKNAGMMPPVMRFDGTSDVTFDRRVQGTPRNWTVSAGSVPETSEG